MTIKKVNTKIINIIMTLLSYLKPTGRVEDETGDYPPFSL